jgi:hypothetical protein
MLSCFRLDCSIIAARVLDRLVIVIATLELGRVRLDFGRDRYEYADHLRER